MKVLVYILLMVVLVACYPQKILTYYDLPEYNFGFPQGDTVAHYDNLVFHISYADTPDIGITVYRKGSILYSKNRYTISQVRKEKIVQINPITLETNRKRIKSLDLKKKEEEYYPIDSIYWISPLTLEDSVAVTKYRLRIVGDDTTRTIISDERFALE
jgi:hypothetical protein